MSLYNMLHGVKPAAFFVLPMIGEGHHAEEFPRFRDCFLGDDEHPEYKDKIIVYTRTGGGNRDDYEAENDWIRSLPGFVADYDDSFDCTFACWVFDVPEQWRPEFDAFMASDITRFRPEYVARLRRVYPKLNETFDKIFAATSERQNG